MINNWRTASTGLKDVYLWEKKKALLGSIVLNEPKEINVGRE